MSDCIVYAAQILHELWYTSYIDKGSNMSHAKNHNFIFSIFDFFNVGYVFSAKGSL